MKSDLVDVTVQAHVESEKAILVSDDGERDNAVWLPKSQIEIERKTSNIMVITMPEWLAVEKGLA